MAVLNGQTTAIEMKTRLREKPLSELIEEMENLSSTSDYDVDLLCAYLDVLEEKAPVLPQGYDPAAEYAKFKEAHAELFEVQEPQTPEKSVSRKGRLFRLRQIAVSFAALFCLLILVADASGAGIFNRLIEWGEETFSLRPTSGIMELESANEGEFCSLQDALAHYGVESAAIPTWIPSRYSIDRIITLESDNSILITGRYLAGSGDFLLIRGAVDCDEDFTFERDPTEKHTLYESNGITFILSTNLDEERAVWTANGYIYSVGGSITEKELKKMLGSIHIEE